MPHKLAIDFGTTNSVVTRWNEATGSAEFVTIPGLNTGQGNGAQFLIPSLLYVEDGRSGQVIIGQAVRSRGLEHQGDRRLFRSFKRGVTAGQSLDSRLIDGTLWAELDAGQHFLCELINRIPYPHTEIENLVITVPVGALDSYTSWLSRVLPDPLPARTRIVDESTAAALGYSVTDPGAVVLIVDFGGGSLDVSLVRLPEDYNRAGRSLRRWLGRKRNRQIHAAHVIAKHGINLGGNDIDQWLLSEVLERSNRTRHDIGGEYAALVVACEQAKIALSNVEETTVTWQAEDSKSYSILVSRSQVETLMEDNGFFTSLRQTVDHVLTAARRDGIYLEDVQHIFMVGGTSLVPAVQTTLQSIFWYSTVRVDKPFTAVAEGALRVAVGLNLDDRLAHSYGLRYLDGETGQHLYDEIIPSGSRYPTRKVVNVHLSAAHPDQQTVEFVIGQIGAGATALVKAHNKGGWIAQADHTAQQIIPVNVHDPLTIQLSPPGSPGEARLQAGFAVDGQRRLRVTVIDRKTGQELLHDGVVVTLGAASDPPDNIAQPAVTGHEPHITTFSGVSTSRFSLRHLASKLNLLPPEMTSLSAIMAALESPSSTDRTRAAEMLSRRGDREARQVIQHIMEYGTPVARASAIHESHRFSWFVVEPLIRQALADSDQRVRESAVYALCKMRLYEAYQLVIDILQQDNDDMRLAAVWALNDGIDAAAENMSRLWDLKGSFLQRSAAPGVGAVPILEIAMQARASHVRIAALEALGAAHIPSAIPTVRAALSDPDSDVQYTAALSLIELAGQECLPELAGRIEQASGQERLPILESLFHATNMLMVDIASSPTADQMVDVLKTTLDEDQADVRIAAAMLLASMQYDRAIEVLRVHYHREQDSEVKTRMRLAAQSFGAALESPG